MTNDLRIDVASGLVSGLWDRSDDATAYLVLAHGAGAGMAHSFMEAVARGLDERGVATLRFQFPFMEAGSGRPDNPSVAQAAVRAVVGAAARLAPDLPLFAGGKSFGGRMTSQAQAAEALPGVRGLVFIEEGTASAGHLAILGGEDELLAVRCRRRRKVAPRRLRHARASRRACGLAGSYLGSHAAGRLGRGDLALALRQMALNSRQFTQVRAITA